MIHGVIMAGGSGTRFWPRSRRKHPKQLLHFTGERSMLQETFQRLVGRIPSGNVHIITNCEQTDGVCRHLPELPSENILVEPASRNTAACIGLAAVRIEKADPDGVMVIVPSDSWVDPAENFLKVIDVACKTAAQGPEMVVIGIPPTYPATGYGYIQRGSLVSESDGVRVFDVRAFKEKPDAKTAADFINSGNYYWNSGSFIWKVSTILDALREFMPNLYAALERIRESLGTPGEVQVVAREYEQAKSISIDYGVMEFARNVKVIEATYKWDDVGTWRSVENFAKPDANGNVVEARAEMIDTQNCTIAGDPDHLIATIGVNDLIIIQTPDATLVCHKDRSQDVKKIVDLLAEHGLDGFL